MPWKPKRMAAGVQAREHGRVGEGVQGSGFWLLASGLARPTPKSE